MHQLNHDESPWVSCCQAFLWKVNPHQVADIDHFRFYLSLQVKQSDNPATSSNYGGTTLPYISITQKSKLKKDISVAACQASLDESKL